jgi:ribosomal protein L35
MKNKTHTHKATAKRFYLTNGGKGKVSRHKRQNRAQRFSRATNRKPKNSDTKSRIIAAVESKKVKSLLN